MPHRIIPGSTSLAGVRTVVARSDRTFARHSHDEYGFGIVTYGSQRSWSSQGSVDATAGDVITVCPGEVHDGAAVGDAPRSWSMLYIEPSVVECSLDGERPTDGEWEFRAPVIKRPELYRRIRSLHEALVSDPQLGKEALVEVLGLVVRRRRSAGSSPRGVARAIQLMDDEYASALSCRGGCVEIGRTAHPCESPREGGAPESRFQVFLSSGHLLLEVVSNRPIRPPG